ncbi:MAG: hypothetical protein RR379_05200 [Clostridia bacterium]
MYDTQDPMQPMTPLTADEPKCPQGELPTDSKPRERLVARVSQPSALFTRPAVPFLTPPKPLYPTGHELQTPPANETKAVAPVVIEPIVNAPARNAAVQYSTFYQSAAPMEAVFSHPPIASAHSAAPLDPDPFPDIMHSVGASSEMDADADQDADEEDEPDAVPTETMPVPVPVPISPITLPKASRRLTYVMVAVTVLFTLLGTAFIASQQLPKLTFSAPTTDHIPAVSFAYADTPCP